MIHLDITEHRHSDGSTRLAVGGEVDTATAEQLLEAAENAIAAAGRSTVTIDLTDVGFLDSTGIRALLTARRLAEAQGAALRVTGARDGVRKVLMVTGVFGLLTAEPAGMWHLDP